MKVWIVVSGKAQQTLPLRCTGAEYEKACAEAAESPIEPYTGRTMAAAGRKVFHAPGRRARETAEQMIPDGEAVPEPLLAPIPRRAFTDAAGERSFRIWNRMARRQARRGDPRQPESRQASIARAEALIARLEAEEKDCVLVLDGDFLTLLLDRFRLHGCGSQRSGLGRWQPFERILVSRRDLHCGACNHNCLLANPGCDIGRDKARRLAESRKTK
ncbi:MAG: hypothetical protein IKO83_03300 [Oscillospiraceae bacterium]|nr:hypothetical protein [Oscillospiraceae bacterium]